jgi:amino-acid N-acetyltransferase
MNDFIIREATIEDLNKIKSLLNDASLPSVDIGNHLQNFLVLETPTNLIGTIGMECYGDMALLRSLAIQESFRKKGYGKELYKALKAKLEKLKINYVYLLTETAEGFFSKEGFQKIAREDVPHSIKQTQEYSNLCPEGAVCMVKILNE